MKSNFCEKEIYENLVKQNMKNCSNLRIYPV